MSIKVEPCVEDGCYAARLKVMDAGELVIDARFYDQKRWKEQDPAPLRYGEVRKRNLWSVLLDVEDDPKVFRDADRVEFEEHDTRDGGWCDGDFAIGIGERIRVALETARKTYEHDGMK